jgi:ABC-type sulfate/molybdate transport systems ATPase subunit
MQQSLGITTVFITHDRTEATALAHRTLEIRNGQIEQVIDY